MQAYKIYFIILVSIAISVLATFFFFDLNKQEYDFNGAVTDLQKEIKDNTKNINKILEEIKSANVNSSSSITTDINQQLQNKESIKRLSELYQSLNDSLQTQLQREENRLTNLPKESASNIDNQPPPERIPVLPPSDTEKNNFYSQLEDNWTNAAGDESEYATSIQNIFSGDLASLSTNNGNSGDLSNIVSNTECKTDVCKVTLEYPEEVKFSATMRLLENAGGLLQGKTITSIPVKDNQTGMIKETVYITKRIGSDLESNDVFHPDFFPKN